MSATQIPEDLSYTRSHEWVKMDGEVATIGITAYAQGELGDIVFVEVPEVGAAVRGDEAFGTIEAVKTVADLIAPASGRVVETNPALADHPELVNSDPYGAGWMIRLRLDDAGGPAGLLSASDYRQLLEAA
jgi:glycine cleavage system H protein